MAVVENTNDVCAQCDLTKEQITADAVLQCYTEPDAVTFRAFVLGDDKASNTMIVDSIEDWVKGSSENEVIITAQRTDLTVNADCDVRIASFNDKGCDVDTGTEAPQSGSGNDNGGVIAGVVVAVVAVIVIVLIIVVGVIFIWRRKQKKVAEYDVFG